MADLKTSEPIDVTPYTPEQLFAAEMANDLPLNMKVRALPRIRATVLALADARADNARLRALVKTQEWGAEIYSEASCPWCGSVAIGHRWSELKEPAHKTDCPAFTSDGEVR